MHTHNHTLRTALLLLLAMTGLARAQYNIYNQPITVSSPAAADILLIWDVSNTSQSVNGSTGRVLLSDLRNYFLGPTAILGVANGGTGGANASDARTNLGLAIGSNVQAYDSDLSSLAALTTASYGRGVLELANAAALRTYGELVIGTHVQAYDADLSSLAALTTAAYGRGVLELANAAALRTYGGLVIGTDVQSYNANTTTLGSSISLSSEVDGTLPVANGGTGITSFGTGVATALGQNVTGSGGAVLATSPTITTPSISGAVSFPDNTRQTFNPGANAAGLNVGALAGDPDTPTNGDLWYDSTSNELTARINGVNTALGGGGGGGGSVTIGSTSISLGGTSTSLAGLTTVAQTDLHTLTSTSNSQTPVNRILLENLQTAVADTESGLADSYQRTPSLRLKSNNWTGSASVARSADIWGEAFDMMYFNFGTGQTDRWFTLGNRYAHFFPGSIESTQYIAIGNTASEYSLSLAVNAAADRGEICGQAIYIALGTQSLTFNSGNTGTSTFAGAATFSKAVTFNGATDSNAAAVFDSTADFNGAVTLDSTVTASAGLSVTSASAPLGYATGAGGTVTQATSRTQPVTINKTCGAITTHTTSLAAAGEATFTVNNDTVNATDTVVLSIKSGAVATPLAWVSAVANDSFNITISNLHATTGETGAIVINFAVIKAAAN